MSFKREPAIWLSLIGALLGVAVSFGLKLSPDQKTAIDAVIAVVIGIVTRSQVTPA